MKSSEDKNANESLNIIVALIAIFCAMRVLYYFTTSGPQGFEIEILCTFYLCFTTPYILSFLHEKEEIATEYQDQGAESVIDKTDKKL